MKKLMTKIKSVAVAALTMGLALGAMTAVAETQSRVYVNSAWAGKSTSEEVEFDGVSLTYGVNAFSDEAEARGASSTSDATTFILCNKNVEGDSHGQNAHLGYAGSTVTGTAFAGEMIEDAGGEITTSSELVALGTSERAGDYANLFGGYDIQEYANTEMYADSSLVVGTVGSAGTVTGGMLVGGSCITAATLDWTGKSTVSVTSGTFTNAVVGGALVTGDCGQCSGTLNTEVTLSGATVKELCGGNYLLGGGGSIDVSGTAKVTLDNCTVTGNVIGGNSANDPQYSTKNTSSLSGNVDIMIIATNGVTTIGGDLVAGSLGTGKVSGNTTITLTGSGDKLSIGGDITGDSSCGTNTASGKWVTGTHTLAFNNFNGTLGSADKRVWLFDAVTLTDSTVTLAGYGNFVDVGGGSARGVSDWQITDGTLNWTKGENNFSGDQLTLQYSGELNGEWTVFRLSEALTKGWNEFRTDGSGVAKIILHVNGDGTIAAWDDSADAYIGTIAGVDYKFYLDKGECSLKVAKIEAKATITVTPVTGASTYKVYTNDTVEVTGVEGVYTVESNAAVTVTYTADKGYVFTQDGETTYTIEVTADKATTTVTIPESEKPFVPVAQLPDRFYRTLQEAIDDSEAGDTVELLRDYTMDKTLVIAEELVDIWLNLCDHTLTSTVQGFAITVENANLYVQNGTINAADKGIVADDAAGLALENIMLTAQNRAIQMNNADDSNDPGALSIDSATSVTSENADAVYCANGNSAAARTVTIEGGVYATAVALTLAGNNATTISSGATLETSGDDAVLCYSGTCGDNETQPTLALYGALNQTSGDSCAKAALFTDSGDAVGVNLTINDEEGEAVINATSDGKAFDMCVPGTVEISAGTFTGAITSSTATKFISGGTFQTADAPAAELIADGYTVTGESEDWHVEPITTVTIVPTPVTGASTVTVSNGTEEVSGPPYEVDYNAAVTVVYTADAGYEFAGGATTWTTNFTASATAITVTIPDGEKPREIVEIGDLRVEILNGGCEIKGEGEGELTAAAVEALKEKAITNLVIGAGITKIASGAFLDNNKVWRKLRNVTIGADCTEIGEQAFAKCQNVTNVTFASTTPVSIGAHAFYRCNSLQTLVFAAEPTWGEQAFTYMTGIYLKDDGEPVVYAMPEVKVTGFSQVLKGTNNLSDPSSWVTVDPNDATAKQKYHFFKIVLEESK